MSINVLNLKAFNGDYDHESDLNKATNLEDVEDDDGGVNIDTRLELKKELGVVYGVAVIMGLVIGGGIYIAPQTVLRHAGSPGLTLVMWFLGGLFSLIGALCFAEIGVKFPRSGAFYAYLMEFYGPYFGFMYLWEYILLVRCGSNALKSSLLATFLLKVFFPSCPIPVIANKLVSSFFSILICVLNCLSVKQAARAQSVMTMVSVTTLSAIAFLGFYQLATGASDHLDKPFSNSSTDPGDLILAIYNTIFAYAGWYALNYITDEVKNPKRTLPISIITTMLIVIGLYLLVNLSYMAVLGTSEMLESEAVAISVALKVWPPMAWIFSICIAITVGSSFNSGVLVGSRLTYVGACDGHVPEVFSYINVSHFTPVISIVSQAIMVLFYIWFMNIEFIIPNLTFCHLIMELLIIVAFMKKRIQNREPHNDQKKLQMPLLLHICYASGLFLLCFVSLVTKPRETFLVFGSILVCTSLLYVVFIKWKPSFATRNSFIASFNRSMQILFQSAPADKSP